jgi:hypothetical protein
MACEKRPLKRHCKTTAGDLGEYDFCIEDLEITHSSLYEDTVITGLQHPTLGCDLQLGFAVRYKSSLRGRPEMTAIIREFLCLKADPRQIVLLAQDAPDGAMLDRMGYDPVNLGLEEKEVCMSSNYTYVPLLEVTGNCVILTFEQYRAYVPDDQDVPDVFLFR